MSSPSYILYKNPVQIDTLEIVQYLHSLGYQRTTPLYCVERNHPKWVTELPSIETEKGDRYVGLSSCVKYYEDIYHLTNLWNLAHHFKKQHPDYRIHN